MCCSAVLDFAAIQLQFRVAQHRSCAAASPAAALSAADTKMSTRQSLSKHRFSEQTQEWYTTCRTSPSAPRTTAYFGALCLGLLSMPRKKM